MPRILIAVPVYNEQQYVTRVLSEIRKYAEDILVIDDGSTDRTPALLADQPVDVIRHAANRGYGRSIRDAFRHAQCYDYEWLITMDCDEQHEPASLPDFYEAIGQDDADVLSGSRYLSPELCGDPPPADRRAINGEITRILNERLCLDITDAFCGFKAYRVDSLPSFHITELGYAMPLQVWVQAAAAGLRIVEHPVPLIYLEEERSFGGSLDDSLRRLAYYREVIDRELGAMEESPARPIREKRPK